jgi:hypothetical protein
MGHPRILLLDADYRASHYAALQQALDAEWLRPPWRERGGAPVPWQEADAYPAPWAELDEVPARQLDLVLVTSEWPPHVGAAVARYAREGVPVLQLADGIVEWRQVWENHGMWRGAPVYQPVLSHKIACLGRAQARLLESWGNLGKCEVTGSPRFDALLGRTARRRGPGEAFRFLVGTAQHPGFDDEQRAAARAGLEDLAHWFEKQDPRAVQPVWRLRGGMDALLGVRNDPTPELADLLPQVDAVITTPSTLALEGMLQGVPVALLDYTNSPPYLRGAWSFGCAAHLEAGLPGMLEPAPERMLFQDFVLHDELECRSAAAPRVAQLALEMAELGRRCRREGRAPEFPPRMLCDPQRGHHLPEEAHDLRVLYPQRDEPAGAMAELQTEVIQLRRLIAIERQRAARWARWGIGSQLLVGVRSALDRLRRLMRGR